MVYARSYGGGVRHDITAHHLKAGHLACPALVVPLFKRLGLGSVLGYLIAGAVIGPFGLALIGDAESVLHFAEFGVVLLLFVIGLDLKPARLWVMRREIFGLGLAQMLLCGGMLMAAVMLLGFGTGEALIVGFGLALSSTAFALQVLEEKGELNSTHGNTSFAILLFQDLCIVPLLALVALLSPAANGGGGTLWLDVAKVVAVILAVVLAGRYLLRPVLRVIAVTRASEIFTAAALLLVVGTPLVVGLHQAVLRRMPHRSEAELEDVSQAQPQRVIVAGFGRVGQIVTQLMAARGITVTAIDHDPKRIEIAKHYCRKVYFADVRRADVLATAGAGEARLIFLCVDDPDACIEAIRHVRAAFPQLEIVARAYDRDHVLRLLKEDVDCFVRETFESSIAMGKEGLRRLDVDPRVVDDIEAEFRRRDHERFRIQQAEGQHAGVEQVFTRYGASE